jgi:hypothetical protein
LTSYPDDAALEVVRQENTIFLEPGELNCQLRISFPPNIFKKQGKGWRFGSSYRAPD